MHTQHKEVKSGWYKCTFFGDHFFLDALFCSEVGSNRWQIQTSTEFGVASLKPEGLSYTLRQTAEHCERS